MPGGFDEMARRMEDDLALLACMQRKGGLCAISPAGKLEKIA
jgi:hypothetical protein